MRITGRDLMVYILQNHLEDEEIFKDGTIFPKAFGFVDVEEAAAATGTGVWSIKALIALGLTYGVTINDQDYIYRGDNINKNT